MLGSDHINALDQNLQRRTASVVRMLSFVRETVQLAKRVLIAAEPGTKRRS